MILENRFMRKKSGNSKEIKLRTSFQTDSWALHGHAEVEAHLNALQKRIDELEYEVSILKNFKTKNVNNE